MTRITFGELKEFTDIKLANSEYIAQMTPLVVPPATPRRKGNPNWGQPMRPAPAVATAFEMQVRHLQLSEDAYAYSRELRLWCELHKNHHFIPEWLLREWGMTVDADHIGLF